MTKMIDLGKKYPSGSEVAAKYSSEDKMSYPTMHITHDIKKDEGLDELPEGEFEFTAKGRVVKYTEDIKNGTCSCEIEVMGISPSTKKAKKSKSSEESLDEALTKVAANKKK